MRFEITVLIEEIIQVSATFVVVTRVNFVHRFISPDLHFSVFGTETISLNTKSIDISVTLFKITLFCQENVMI